jgi:flagellar biosynthesis protein FlhF
MNPQTPGNLSYAALLAHAHAQMPHGQGAKGVGPAANAMTPRTFRGSTVHDAKKAALDALGPQASILATREIKKAGPLGWFSRSTWEVAALAPEPEPAIDPSRPFAAGVYEGRRSDEIAELRTELRREVRALRAAVARPTTPTRIDTPLPSAVADELAAVRALLEEGLHARTPKKDRIATFLRDRGLEGPVATHLARLMKQPTGERAGERANEDDDLATLYRRAVSLTLKTGAWPLAEERASVIALVGPTGVGKTTTAAKIAAHAIKLGRSVTFVACDGYRVGAIDQVRRYADALRAKVVVASSKHALEEAVKGATTDVVLVDTAGQGPTAPEGPEAAIATLGTGTRRARAVLLCMTATTRARDAQRIAQAFGIVKPSALAITKIDETDTPAGLLHGAHAARLPIGVLTFGQRVPEDIQAADEAAVLRYLDHSQLAHESVGRVTALRRSGTRS